MNQPTLQTPKVSEIRASLTNPRKRFDDAYLKELAESIKTLGVLQPILCRPIVTSVLGPTNVEQLEIVAGECRWRASKIAGLDTIPALVRSMTDLEALEIQVIENLQRKDLHPIEEAEGYQQLMEKHGFTADQLAAKVSKSKAYIYARLKLSALESSARKAFFDGNLTPSAALLIARIPVPTLQAKAAKEIIKGGRSGEPMSQREIINHLDRHYMLLLKDAPFKADDEKLLLKVGSCTKCPKRTGNQSVLFSDVKSADVCTDPVCFEAKRNAWSVIQIKHAKEAGKTVIEGADAKKVFPHEYCPENPIDAYKKPTDVCWSDLKNRTYGQLAKLATVAPVVVKNPNTGSVVELIKVAELTPALKEMGVDKPSGPNPNTEAAKKAKAETAFRTEVFDQVRVNADANGWYDADWQMIACSLVRRLDSNDLRALLSALGWDKDLGTWEGKKGLTSKIESLSMKELSALMLAAALINEVRAATYSNSKPEALFAAADRHGVDVEKIKARIKAAEKEKLDAKKKVSAKKGPPQKVGAIAVGAIAVAMKDAKVAQKKASKKAPPKVAKPEAAEKTAMLNADIDLQQGSLPVGIDPAAAWWASPTATEIAEKKAATAKPAAGKKPAKAKTATTKKQGKADVSKPAATPAVFNAAAVWPFPTGSRP